MADNTANSVRTTRVRARIYTLLIYASQMAGTFPVADTFWPAVGRYSEKVGQA